MKLWRVGGTTVLNQCSIKQSRFGLHRGDTIEVDFTGRLKLRISEAKNFILVNP